MRPRVPRDAAGASRVPGAGGRLLGVDPPVAARNIAAAGLADRIELGREDLLALSFADASFATRCAGGCSCTSPTWRRAVAELSRAMAPGGTLVVAESNSRSLEGLALRALAPVRGAGRSWRPSPAGMESWKETEAGPLLTRVADVGWLRDEFARHGVVLKRRLPGQFTELHAKAPWPWLAARPARLQRRLVPARRAGPGPPAATSSSSRSPPRPVVRMRLAVIESAPRGGLSALRGAARRRARRAGPRRRA